MKKIDSLIAPQTKEFVKQCRQYIIYMEQMPDTKKAKFWAMLLRLLPEIYSGVLRLPIIDARYTSEGEKFVTEREYDKIFTKLVSFVGALDRFPDFDDLSHPGTVKVTELSLSEMLADIYQEVKDFVLLYETGTLENMNDAIAEFCDTFERSWGLKLLRALRIIHVNLYQKRYAEAQRGSQQDTDMDEEYGEESE